MSLPNSPLIALATYAEKPDLTPDDALLIPELKRLGAELFLGNAGGAPARFAQAILNQGIMNQATGGPA